MLPDDEELLVDAAGVDDSFLGEASFFGDESLEEEEEDDAVLDDESDDEAAARESVR